MDHENFYIYFGHTGVTVRVDFIDKQITIDPISFKQWKQMQKKGQLQIVPPKEMTILDASLGEIGRSIERCLKDYVETSTEEVSG